MREKLRKTRSRINLGKDVTFKVEKSGLKSDGTQRWAGTFRFYNGSEKKISDSGYAAIDIDQEERRVYFVESDATEGWKLVGLGNVRSLSFTFESAAPAHEWVSYEGEYNLLKDTQSGDYYIDLK